LRAVFIERECLFPGGQQEESASALPPDDVLEGLRALSRTDLLLLLVDSRCGGAARHEETERFVKALPNSGARMDAWLHCPHESGETCDCWGTYPGFLYHAAGQLELRLEECFLLCARANDVTLAYMAGCRPVLCLNGRSIGDLYGGHQPEPRDFPVARDFGRAVGYVLAEAEANEMWGHARPPSSIDTLSEEVQPSGETPEFSPVLHLLTPVPLVRGLVIPGLSSLGRRARQWLALFVVGGVWLSLGIAYLLTHLYRVQPFPEFVYYLTLQFIPRPLRGVLFIGSGVAVVYISLRAVWRLSPRESSGGRE
jgi:hypothetical protein